MSMHRDFVPRRTRRRTFWIATIAAGVFFMHGAQALITVGPDADLNCQFHDIGSAVQAAEQSPGADVVAISSGTYTGISTIFVNSSDDTIIEGGFADCSAGISSGTSTLDAAGAANHGSLIAHFGSGHLRLLHLVLTNGDANAGGGVDSEGSGPLTMSDVSLFTNSANYGGGLFVGGGTLHKTVTMTGVRFNSNTAHASGGGMYVRDADVTIASGRESYFLGNLAQGAFPDTGDGGGIYAINSNLYANTHGIPGFPFIGSNLANRNGGGVYFSVLAGGLYFFLLSNDSASNPLEISDNAAPDGGGVYMRSYSPTQEIGSIADFRNVVMRGNTANYGAAVSIDSNGQDAGVTTAVRFSQSEPGDQAPPCAAGLRCNSLEGNLANSGYIISANASGPEGAASVEFVRGRMLDNSTVSGGGGLIFGGNASLYVDGSLFAHNTLSGELMTVVQSDLHFANSTVAYNQFGADQLFTVAITPASLEILHSLLVQPDDPVNGYLVGAGIPVIVQDIGAMNVGLAGNNVQFLTDPFVDAANGDFHILQTSSAVDRWAATSNIPNDYPPTLDLDGGLRPHVLHPTSTPYDFGAYEAGAVVDTIFRDGFELPDQP